MNMINTDHHHDKVNEIKQSVNSVAGKITQFSFNEIKKFSKVASYRYQI